MLASVSTSADALADHLIRRLRERPADWLDPFPVHHLTDALPISVIEDLRGLPVEPRTMTGARAHNNGSRFYFNTRNQERFPIIQTIASAFQQREVVLEFSRVTGTSYESCHVLPELTCDTGISALVPHRDIGPKRLTALFYLEPDTALSDSGTDIYTARPECGPAIALAAAATGEAPREYFERQTMRPVYESGNGHFFKPDETSWHGFDTREIRGVRKTLILNYVGPTASDERYRNIGNLSFPDKPVL